MRLITSEDIDVAATLALCARMGNRRKVLERLRDRYEDPEANARAVVDYGLCRAVFLLNDPNDTDKGPHQVAALEAFSRCLDIDARWWLPRFLRIELASVPAGTAGGGSVAPPPERDIETLLAQQASAGEQRPYFISTHAAKLRARLRSGLVEKSTAEFAAAAQVLGVTPAGFSFPYLDLPFRESVILLRHLGRTAEADAVKATGLAIYPKSLPLQLA